MVTFTRMPLFTRGYWSEVSRITALLRRETGRCAVLLAAVVVEHGQVANHGAR